MRRAPVEDVTGDHFLHLRPLVASLVEGLRPEKIILFGSHARGTQSRTSDVDLFIVQETDSPPLERIGEALEHLPALPYGVDVIVYRPDELRKRRDSPFLRRILSEGVVLYERASDES